MPFSPLSRLVRAVAVISVLWLVAPAARAEDDVAEAMEGVNRQIAANPKDGRLLLLRSRLQTVARKYDLALADLDQANRVTPLPEIGRERAQVYLTAGWYETGVEHINRHLTKFPEDGAAYLTRARLRVKLDQRAEAAAD